MDDPRAHGLEIEPATAEVGITMSRQVDGDRIERGFQLLGERSHLVSGAEATVEEEDARAGHGWGRLGTVGDGWGRL